MYQCVTGNRCPPYPTFSHTQMFKPQSTDVTNNVLYACDNGYVFADNSVINKLTCGQTLTWQGTIPTCNGEFIAVKSKITVEFINLYQN
jgi:hypothetical protein